MDTAAVTETLVKKFGKKFFFITPDYAYGHALQEASSTASGARRTYAATCCRSRRSISPPP